MSSNYVTTVASALAAPFRLTQANDSAQLAVRGGNETFVASQRIFAAFPEFPGWLPYHPDLNPNDWRMRHFALEQLLKSDPKLRGQGKDSRAEQVAAALAAYLEHKRQVEISAQQEEAEKFEIFRQYMVDWRLRTMQAELLHVLLRLSERDRTAQRHELAYADFDLRQQTRRDVIKDGKELNIALQDSMRKERQVVADTRAERQSAGVDIVQNWAALSQAKALELQALPIASDPAAATSQPERNKIVEMRGRSAYAAAAKLT